MAQVERSGVRWGPIFVWGALAAGFSALARPAADAGEALAPLGVSAAWIAPVAHAVPVVVIMALMAGHQLFLRGAPWSVRMAALGLAGGVTGFVTAFLLDAFAALIPMTEAMTGALRDPTGTDFAAWVLAAFSLFYGLLTLSLGLAGTPMARAVQVDVVDPSCMEVRARERADYVASGFGLLGHGMLLAALALAHQAQSAPAPALIAAGAVGAALFIGSSVILWRRFDELMRRVVVDAYAVSAIVVTVLVVAAAFGEGAGWIAPVGAYAVAVALLTVQTIAAMWISTALLAPAAAPKRRRA